MGARAGEPRFPAVSVVIAAHTMERWGDLVDAVASARGQTAPALETIVVVDHNDALLTRARAELSGVSVLANSGSPGASGARNTGVAASSGEVVAFLDDDAVAAPTWLAALLGHFAEPGVVGVGGRLEPLWASARPGWFPPEFDWVVGASYRGMPAAAGPVRNVWSNNMAIRRAEFDRAGGFRDDFGKVGTRSRPEDTDLCLRASAAGSWIYEPASLALHRVPRERATLGYFVYRCFHEGWGKAALASLDGVHEATSAERRHALRVLPAGIARGVRESAHGDASGALRALSIMLGLGAAAAGFAAGGAAGLGAGERGRRRAAGRPLTRGGGGHAHSH